ncbi:MAG TPA: MFS transporter [Solibacterales bacterium]|jgi:MFS family permease|nr:MFS transporter [Bryobacterales bacterium]
MSQRAAWWNRNVAGMTFTSLLSDACYEMVLAVVPGFLPVIGVSAAALGWIEGLSDGIASVLKLVSGWWTDRLGHRKTMVTVGYFFTGTGLSLFALAFAWPMILAGRMVSWFGKGIRGSLRDAMLSESVPPEVRGKAFGIHRAGDTVGAVLGPLCGALLLHILPHQPPDLAFRRVFLLSLIPGLAAPLVFWIMVREQRRQPRPRVSMWLALRQQPAAFRRFLTAVGLFGAGDFSPTLLIMAAAVLLTPRFGGVRAAEFAALFYVARNIVYAAASYPIGALGDRVSKTALLSIGYGAAALTALGVALMFRAGSTSAWAMGALFVLSGIFASAQETMQGAITPDLTEAAARGTAYGTLGLVNGAGDLIASALLGTLWSVVSPAAGFGAAALLMGAGAVAIARVKH